MTDLTDTDLAAVEAEHTPPEVPAECSVCGGPMALDHTDTEYHYYYCAKAAEELATLTAATDTAVKRRLSNHRARSLTAWRDTTDRRVRALCAELRERRAAALTPTEAERVAWIRDNLHTVPEWTEDDLREFYGRDVPFLLELAERLKGGE